MPFDPTLSHAMSDDLFYKDLVHYLCGKYFPTGTVFLIGFVHSNWRNTMFTIGLIFAFATSGVCAGLAVSG